MIFVGGLLLVLVVILVCLFLYMRPRNVPTPEDAGAAAAESAGESQIGIDAASTTGAAAGLAPLEWDPEQWDQTQKTMISYKIPETVSSK